MRNNLEKIRGIRPSTYSWFAIAAGVAVYDALCPKGEQLSERFDEWLEKPSTRVIAMGTTALTALHLTNMLPERLDPIHHLAKLGRKVDDNLDVWGGDDSS